jgi:hypothetical protein
MDPSVIFAWIIAVLAGAACIGALAFVIVWEVCAIRRTLADHRRRPPEAPFWSGRGAATPTSPAEQELVPEGARRILAGHPLRGIALDWKGRDRHSQRRP